MSEAQAGSGSAPSAPSRRREWLQRLALLGASLLVCILFAEVALRIAGVGEIGRSSEEGAAEDADGFTFFAHDPALGWDLVPGAVDRHVTDEFDVTIRIDEKGLRSPRRELDGEDEGARRIVVLGDSFTFGHGVEIDDAWTSRVERRLGGASPGGVEILNQAVTGYGVDQMILRYQERGDREESVVLLAVFVGDVFRVADEAYMGYAKPRFELRFGELRRSRDAVPAEPPAPPALRLHRLWNASGLRVWRHLGGGSAWPVTRALLHHLRRVAQRRGAEVVGVVIPKDRSIYGSGLRYRLHDRTLELVGGMLDDAGIPHLDLTPALRRAAAERTAERTTGRPGERLYYPVDGHWTPAGHAVAAEAIRPWLEERLGEGGAP